MSDSWRVIDGRNGWLFSKRDSREEAEADLETWRGHPQFPHMIVIEWVADA